MPDVYKRQLLKTYITFLLIIKYIYLISNTLNSSLYLLYYNFLTLSFYFNIYFKFHIILVKTYILMLFYLILKSTSMLVGTIDSSVFVYHLNNYPISSNNSLILWPVSYTHLDVYKRQGIIIRLDCYLTIKGNCLLFMNI